MPNPIFKLDFVKFDLELLFFKNMNSSRMKFAVLVFVLFLSGYKKLNASTTIDLVATDLKGKIFDLREMRGKVVIITFWASWCGVCLQEMPALEELYSQYKKEGLEIIAISIDDKDSRQEVLKIASNFSYPNSNFYQVKSNALSEPRIVPLNYIIDKNGELISRLLVEDETPIKEQFEKIIKPLLVKKNKLQIN